MGVETTMAKSRASGVAVYDTTSSSPFVTGSTLLEAISIRLRPTRPCSAVFTISASFVHTGDEGAAPRGARWSPVAPPSTS